MVQMGILSCSILVPLQRSNVATSPASIHRLVSTRHLLSSMASGTPRWWSSPSGLARRVSPLFQDMRHVSRRPEALTRRSQESLVFCTAAAGRKGTATVLQPRWSTAGAITSSNRLREDF
ncbi:hypothetical protein PVAP13_1NG042216 [Panicum virgatum]|uniref:Uncharacterized protein n=1 Tax=Panicum virgatum TaxID=38727 RepID=A0A8T0WHD3_PANVG|nr:hypothetical protein PVAP13_1NG042216 [Panicum virgatum]